MSDILVTRLRYVKSKDPDELITYLNSLLTYKVEIKGNPVYAKGKWFLWFVLPENQKKEVPLIDLD